MESIQKELVMKCFEYMADMVVDRPVKVGDVLVENILDTGVNIVSTADYPY